MRVSAIGANEVRQVADEDLNTGDIMVEIVERQLKMCAARRAIVTLEFPIVRDDIRELHGSPMSRIESALRETATLS